jgi:hypothetical protein
MASVVFAEGDETTVLVVDTELLAAFGWPSPPTPPGRRAPAARPFDLASLEAVSGVRLTARRLGVSGATFSQMRQAGLTERQADAAATKLGLHPGDAWGHWWLDVVEDLDEDHGKAA